ncbi:5'-nucleotidase [Streptomyces sp. NPDC020403]|uniref:5'-nucleotidase n=1 Tax=unclassified Streptomyces TaxID=2593676 RepID=UPI00340047EB
MYKRMLRSALAASFVAAMGFGLSSAGDIGWSSEAAAAPGDIGWNVQAAAPKDIGWIAPQGGQGDIGWNAQGDIGWNAPARTVA